MQLWPHVCGCFAFLPWQIETCVHWEEHLRSIKDELLRVYREILRDTAELTPRRREALLIRR